MCLQALSLGIDIDWLISDYYPVPLNANADTFIYSIQQEAILSRDFAWLTMMMNILLKTLSFVVLLFDSNIGSQMLSTAWKQIQLFLPPTSTSNVPLNVEELKAAMESRIIAIVWVEMISTALIIILAIYANLRLSWDPLFQSKLALVTVQNTLYLKGVMGILLVMALLKNCNKSYLLSGFWSFDLNSRSPRNYKVKIDGIFLRFNGTLKFISTVIGILTLCSIIHAWAFQTIKTPKEVRVVLGIMVTSLIMTDFLAVTLFITVFCYAHKYNSLNAMNPKPALSFSNGYNQYCDDLERIDATSNKSFIVPLGVSPTSTSKITDTMILSKDVACSPSEFSRKWKSLNPGSCYNFVTSRIPTLDECKIVLERNRFYPIASGIVDGGYILRLFIVAQPVNVPVLFLCEVSFEPIKMYLKLELKLCPSQAAWGHLNALDFLETLPLVELFGDIRKQKTIRESTSPIVSE